MDYLAQKDTLPAKKYIKYQINFGLKLIFTGLGDGPFGKVPTIQTRGPEFRFLETI